MWRGSYPSCMAKTVQIRNVPEALHCRLKSRAALEGMSLSDYPLAELRRVAERPTLAEMRERLERRPATAQSITRRGDPRRARCQVIAIAGAKT